MNVQISKLTSGLKVVTEELPHLQTAALGIWINVGARHESESHNGVAHFLEHMMFKGTHRANAKQIVERIENIGGYINAFTTREVTAYYTRVLSQDYQVALNTLSDVLQFSTFDTHELEKERKVILQEISESNDTPDDLVFDLFQTTAYPDQSMGRAILGTSEIIQRLPRDDLVRFYTQNYTFQNMVLSAVGNIRHQDVVDFSEQKFTHLTSDFLKNAPSATYHGGLCIQHKDLEQVHVVLGFPAPAFMQDGYFSCAVLSTLFGGGMSSRLFQQVRENLG